MLARYRRQGGPGHEARTALFCADARRRNAAARSRSMTSSATGSPSTRKRSDLDPPPTEDQGARREGSSVVSSWPARRARARRSGPGDCAPCSLRVRPATAPTAAAVRAWADRGSDPERSVQTLVARARGSHQQSEPRGVIHLGGRGAGPPRRLVPPFLPACRPASTTPRPAAPPRPAPHLRRPAHRRGGPPEGDHGAPRAQLHSDGTRHLRPSLPTLDETLTERLAGRIGTARRNRTGTDLARKRRQQDGGENNGL
jgi:hypothetical protein